MQDLSLQSAGEAVEETTTALLETVYFGNDVRTWLIALAVFAGTLATLVVLRSLVVRRLATLASRTTTHVDDVVIAVLRRTRIYFLVALALTAASLVLVLPERTEGIIRVAATLAVLVQMGLWANEAIGLWLHHVASRKAATDVASVTTINALGILARMILWVIVFLLALETFGVDVTALIAGLGIAGIAVALAVQNVLGDLLASLSIVLDKPFLVGDFIVVDTFSGTVEEVGLKTTRVRSISGEQVIFSNTDLLKARVRNYKRMTERRIVFGFGLEYDTPPEVVAQVPPIVREIIGAIEQTRVDRAHFFRFGPSSLDFEVVYFVTVPEYNVYMDIQQRINLELMRRLEAIGAAFAFPTQTLYVKEAGELADRLAGGAEEAPAPAAAGSGVRSAE